MFLMYVIGFIATYIGLVIFNKDSLIGRDVTDNTELYIVMLFLSLIFPLTLSYALCVFITQRFLELSKGRKNENV